MAYFHPPISGVIVAGVRGAPLPSQVTTDSEQVEIIRLRVCFPRTCQGKESDARLYLLEGTPIRPHPSDNDWQLKMHRWAC